MKKGKFIVIEGTDGSGKATQTALLKERLQKEGIKVTTDDYPHYDEFWGNLVGRMLMKEFGDPFNISPYLTVLPYIIDEYVGSLKIRQQVENGEFVLSNRYFTANVHQVAKLTGRAQSKFRKWLWEAGWNQLGIYKPDLVIVLMVDPKIVMKLIKKKSSRSYTKGKKRDAAEEKFLHQQASAKEYKRMCKTNDNWLMIKCCNQKREILSPEEIHKKVYDLLRKKRVI